MKLESLKSSKFEAFKGSEIVNLTTVVGGATWNTTDNCIDGRADWSYRDDATGWCTTAADGDTEAGPGKCPTWF
jgi:hypothetical protein